MHERMYERGEIGFSYDIGGSLILSKVQNNEREKKRHARSFIRLLTNELAGIVLYAYTGPK